jgi:transposase
MDLEVGMSRAKTSVAQKFSALEQIVIARWTPEVFRRFQCIWLTHVLDLPAQEIAKALDLNVSTIRRIRAEFARDGIRAIDGKGNRGGRRNQCMSFEEEAAFLKAHTELFNRAGIGDIRALKEAFEASVGRTVHKTTIYRLLERHGRKKLHAETGRSNGEVALTGTRGKGFLAHRGKVARVR